MNTITIHTQSKQYPAVIGHGASAQLAPFIKEKFAEQTKILIITDEHVAKLHLNNFENSLSGFDCISYVVPSGETAKTFDVYYQLLSFALENRMDRKSLIIAFGGGAVGDVSGFVAGTFMRGIPFIQVPTTILAHDSAVGGKVAINHPLGKNMIGVFHQPEAVIYDLDFLQSLPLVEKRSGFAEVVKEALIHNDDFYKWLISNIHSLETVTSEELNYFLAEGMKIKGSIVSEDEKETGVRAFLNFGHTLGHAIEAELGYGKMTHGEAVTIGMVFALELSNELLGLKFDMNPFVQWLKQLGYTTTIPEQLNNQNLLDRMKLDKKSVGQKVRFILLEKVGTPIIYEIDDAFLNKKLESFRGGLNS